MIRLTLAAALAALVAGLLATTALAETPVSAAAPVPATKAATEAAHKPDQAAVQAAASPEPYTPPPGFKTKKRKGETVYCRSRAPLGTRIKTEECFTKAEILEVERAMQMSTEDIQQRGRMCTTGMMCTGQGGG